MDYDFDIVYNKGIKHQDADFLSRNPFKEENEKEKQMNGGCAEQTPTRNAEPHQFILYSRAVRFELEEEPVDFNDWNKEKTIQAQKEDPVLGEIYKFLTNPNTLDRSHRRKLQQTYELIGGVLHRKTNVFGVNQFVIYVPQGLVRQVLYHAHDAPVAAHYGIKKTAWKVSQNFYWPGMTIDIRDYVRSCKECQFRKTPTTAKHSPQSSLPIPPSIFHTLAIDVVGPLPVTENGYKYFVSVTDALSKYAITYPIKEASDEEIMRKLEKKVFCVFGAPKVILKDQGTNLNSNYCQKLYDSWGIKSVRTTAYHPQGNGQTERFNKTIGTSLATLSTN